jgi:hypothetical protein
MDNSIHIVSKIEISESWISDFHKALNKNNIKFSYERLRFTAHFDGPVSEILVLIKENPYSIILAPALYDILKNGLKFLMKSIKKPREQKAVIVDYENIDGNTIRISFPHKLKSKELELVIDKFLKTLLQEQTSLFEKEQYIDKSNISPTVYLEYNQQTELWEPQEILDRNKDMEDLMDKLRNELDA